jgi:poly(3-hydroxybutyrate) depolymerase
MPDLTTRHRLSVLTVLMLLVALGCGGSTGSVGEGAAGMSGSAGVGTGAAGTGAAGTGAAGTGAAGSNAAGSGAAGSGASACGNASAPKGVTNGTAQVNGAARAYVLSVPTGYDPARRWPLVFAYHGLGGSGTLARSYFRVEQAAEGEALFVYPSGVPQPTSGGQPAWDLSATGTDVAFFDALLAKLSADYCVDTTRIFAAGHSYGGYFTNRLGCTRGNVLRAIGPVAGGPPFGTCQGEVGAFVVHGMNDPVVAFAQGEATRNWWTRANACAATTMAAAPSPCVAFDGCKADQPVLWCVHQDMHNWPSFAGAALWTFFSSFK